ncbi:MAG: SctD/MshK family protein, partial [Geminicoccaceae bacterium]
AASDEPARAMIAAEASIGERSTSQEIEAKEIVEGKRRERADVVKATPDVTLDDAAAALRSRLAEEGLRHIEVKTAVDRLLVRGEAEPERLADWQTIRVWFDSTFGQNVLLVAAVDAVENREPPALAIEAVWSGDDPYLIAGGKRFFVGAAIGDGWTIERIDGSEITFKRGNRTFSLTL